MPGSSPGMTYRLASLPVMPISDIRSGTVVAGQKFKKLFALPTAVPPGGKSAQLAAKKFDDARGRRARRVRPDAENLRRYARKIAIGHDALRKRHERNVVALSRLDHPITDFRAALFRLRTVLA